MKHFFRILIYLFILASNACEKNENIIPTQALPNEIKSIFEIREWLLIGPFEYDTLSQHPSETYNIAENLPLGFDENGIDGKTIKKLLREKVKPFYANRKNASINFFDYVNGIKKDKSNFYAYTNIFCLHEREVILVCDGSSSYAIWINGVKVQETKDKCNTYKLGDKFVKIKLKKGNNLIFAKINRGGNLDSWKLILGITNLRYAQELYLTNYMTDFIHNPVTNSILSIYTGPWNNGSVNISKNETQLNIRFTEKDVKNSFVSIALPDSFADGFYKCHMQLENNILEEYFFKGNFKNFYNTILLQKKLPEFDNNTLCDLQSSLERLEYIEDSFKKEISETDTGLYDLNRVVWSKILIDAVDYIKQNENLKNKPGTTLKTYTNPQTGQTCNFLFHVDKNLLNTKKTLPVILIPVCDTIQVKMVHNTFLSNLSQINADCKLADEKGFAICWLFLNGSKYNLRKSANEVSIVLTKLIFDYPTIDTTNVFLAGESEGGQRALLLAQMQPYKYSGLAVFNPFTQCDENINNPINFVDNLSNMHVMIMHGQKFESSPFENFLQFVEKGNKLGLKKLSYKQIKNGKLEFSLDYKRPIFDFFEKIYRITPFKSPNYIRFRTFDNSFNTAYWLKFTAKNDSSKSVIVARYSPYSLKISLKCININTITIDASKLGIPRWKKLQFSANGIRNKIVYDQDGNIKIAL